MLFRSIIKNITLIDKNIYYLEDIINKLCKKKIKLYNKTKNKKYLSIILNKTIGLKEKLIFQYSNKIDKYNKLEIKQNNSNKCDIKLNNDCINFYNCDNYGCKNLNYESTYTYKDSLNIKINISSDFNIEKVIYLLHNNKKKTQMGFMNFIKGSQKTSQSMSSEFINLLNEIGRAHV